MINVNTKDFEEAKGGYSKITLIKEYKNGSKDYKVLCTCGKCGGTGHVYSTLDHGRCWRCNETGKVIETIHVSDTTRPALTPEEIEERAKALKQKEIDHNIELGYKKVDFEIAKWAKGIWFNFDSYYRIIKETDKAFLMSRLDNISDSYLQDIQYWIPKKAITFVKEDK